MGGPMGGVGGWVEDGGGGEGGGALTDETPLLRPPRSFSAAEHGH